MKALLIVDIQNDFLPGGSLPIPEGERIIPVVNALIEAFDHVIASKDWHPPGHCSFAIWPQHCVQHSFGAEFPQALHQEKIKKVFFKGSEKKREGYSAFAKESGLTSYLQEQGIDELFVVGLATDYCVKETVLDGLQRHLKISVVKEGCRAAHDQIGALAKMKEAGASII
ncbi:MAG: isochorismatase family protein [Chlamydiales bacterium]